MGLERQICLVGVHGHNCTIELSFQLNGLLVKSCLSCLQHLPCLVGFWGILGGSVEV